MFGLYLTGAAIVIQLIVVSAGLYDISSKLQKLVNVLERIEKNGKSS